MAATVLIASPEYLAGLKDRDELTDALAFSDTDALTALDAITRQPPEVVALERLFAASSRGAALINRIKADPSLAGCEIRIVAHDSAYSRVAPRPAAAGAPASVAVVEQVEAAAVALDEHGTRRAPRYDIQPGVEVLIDGNPAALIDLSTVGAQVTMATILKPNQRVRMSLPETGRPIRFGASVAWASFEMPKEGPRYRAGIEFFNGDADAIQRFIDAHKRD